MPGGPTWVSYGMPQIVLCLRLPSNTFYRYLHLHRRWKNSRTTAFCSTALPAFFLLLLLPGVSSSNTLLVADTPSMGCCLYAGMYRFSDVVVAVVRVFGSRPLVRYYATFWAAAIHLPPDYPGSSLSHATNCTFFVNIIPATTPCHCIILFFVCACLILQSCRRGLLLRVWTAPLAPDILWAWKRKEKVNRRRRLERARAEHGIEMTAMNKWQPESVNQRLGGSVSSAAAWRQLWRHQHRQRIGNNQRRDQLMARRIEAAALAYRTAARLAKSGGVSGGVISAGMTAAPSSISAAAISYGGIHRWRQRKWRAAWRA